MGDLCSPIPRVISGFHSVALGGDVGLLLYGDFVKGETISLTNNMKVGNKTKLK